MGGRYARRVRHAVVPDRSAEALGDFIEGAVTSGTPVITDDWSDYASLATRGYKHLAVAKRGDAQVAEEHLPIVHLVFSNLKTWLGGIHHSVRHQHLQAYLNDFTFRFNWRFHPFNAFRSLLGIAGDITTLTYAELYCGDWTHPRCSGLGNNRKRCWWLLLVPVRRRAAPAGRWSYWQMRWSSSPSTKASPGRRCAVG